MQELEISRKVSLSMLYGEQFPGLVIFRRSTDTDVVND